MRDAKLAITIAWLVLSAMAFCLIAAPFLLSPEQIARISPVCEWKATYHRECPLCGMTTAFTLIARGELRASGRANRAGIPLYAFFVLNELAVLFCWRKGGLSCRS